MASQHTKSGLSRDSPSLMRRPAVLQLARISRETMLPAPSCALVFWASCCSSCSCYSDSQKSPTLGGRCGSVLRVLYTCPTCAISSGVSRQQANLQTSHKGWKTWWATLLMCTPKIPHTLGASRAITMKPEPAPCLMVRVAAAPKRIETHSRAGHHPYKFRFRHDLIVRHFSKFCPQHKLSAGTAGLLPRVRLF